MAASLTHDELRELLAAYALDAVDQLEVVALEAHLADCAECRHELGSLREVAGSLGSEPADPPDHLWNRISTQLQTEPPSVSPTLQLARRQAPSRAPRRVTLFAAAAAVVLLAGVASLGWLTVSQQHRLDRLNGQLASINSHQNLSDAAAKAASTQGARQIALRRIDGSRLATVTMLPSGDAYVVPASGMRSLPRSRTYQLWAMRGVDRISLGVLGASPGITQVRMPTRDINGLAITDEAEPGAIVSTTPPVGSAPIRS